MLGTSYAYTFAYVYCMLGLLQTYFAYARFRQHVTKLIYTKLMYTGSTLSLLTSVVILL